MSPVNMLEAKTTLSRLVEAVETGAETEIIIARNGRPAARLVPIAPARKRRQGGLANGLLKVPEDFDAYNDEILAMFDASE
jgi:prevent-host-death family protein